MTGRRIGEGLRWPAGKTVDLILTKLSGKRFISCIQGLILWQGFHKTVDRIAAGS
jgi:hypothetical protein